MDAKSGCQVLRRTVAPSELQRADGRLGSFRDIDLEC